MHWNRTIGQTGGILLFATLALLSGRLLLFGGEKTNTPVLFPDTGESFESIFSSAVTLDRLPTGHIAFDSPNSMEVGHTYKIALALSAGESKTDIESSVARMAGSQPMQSADVKYSLQMDTQLTGPTFDIKSVTPASQTTSIAEESQWIWNVVPTQAGNQALHIILDANLDRGGSTVEQTIEVKVRPAR